MSAGHRLPVPNDPQSPTWLYVLVGSLFAMWFIAALFGAR